MASCCATWSVRPALLQQRQQCRFDPAACGTHGVETRQQHIGMCGQDGERIARCATDRLREPRRVKEDTACAREKCTGTPSTRSYSSRCAGAGCAKCTARTKRPSNIRRTLALIRVSVISVVSGQSPCSWRLSISHVPVHGGVDQVVIVTAYTTDIKRQPAVAVEHRKGFSHIAARAANQRDDGEIRTIAGDGKMQGDRRIMARCFDDAQQRNVLQKRHAIEMIGQRRAVHSRLRKQRVPGGARATA